MLNSKLLIVCLIIFSILVVLYVLGKKSVHHESIIPASPQEVWAVLVDTDNYKNWNPVMELLEGEVKEGNNVKYRFTQDKEHVSEIPSQVKKMTKAALLNQYGGLTGVITFDHRYILEPVEKGTKLIIHEDYRGIYVPFWNPAPVEAAYGKLANALKEQVIKVKSGT